jgi:DNA-binding cell septation regulator SpoVG
MNTPTITVRDLRVLPNSPGNLKAYADIVLDGITIREVRIVQEQGRSPFVQAPLKKTDYQGVTVWRPLITWSDAHQKAIQSLVLAVYRQKLKGVQV